MSRLASIFLFCAAFAIAQNSSELVNLGVQAFKSAKYQEAVQHFQQAVAANPSDVPANLYLATAWMSQYVPGADSQENLGVATAADRQFRRVLELDSSNQVALESLASLHYNMSQGQQPLDSKLRHLEDAAGWYNKVLAVNPNSKTAHYSLGVITWSQFYPELMAARREMKMRPEDPGPLRDANLRVALRVKFESRVNEGIQHLNTALVIDPQYDDAMAYLNLLVRERADLYDTPEEYKRDIEVADGWVQKALDTKKRKAEQSVQSGARPAGMPTQIRVGGNVQAAKLVEKPTPVYPDAARQARIQGVARFNVLVGKDGSVQNLTLVSGHPLFVQPAMEAVKGYRYQPTLLNGQPVEVVTQVDVNFTLTP